MSVPRRSIAFNYTRPPSMSGKRARSSEITCAQVVNLITPECFTNLGNLDSNSINSGTHCRVCYSTKYNTLKYRQLKKYAYFVKTRDRDYEARLGSDGDHRRQKQHPVNHPPRALHETHTVQKHFIIRLSTAVIHYIRQDKARILLLIFENPNQPFGQCCISLGTGA